MEQVGAVHGIVCAGRTGVCRGGQRAAAGCSGTNAEDSFFAAMVNLSDPG